MSELYTSATQEKYIFLLSKYQCGILEAGYEYMAHSWLQISEGKNWQLAFSSTQTAGLCLVTLAPNNSRRSDWFVIERMLRIPAWYILPSLTLPVCHSACHRTLEEMEWDKGKEITSGEATTGREVGGGGGQPGREMKDEGGCEMSKVIHRDWYLLWQMHFSQTFKFHKPPA